VALDIAVRMPNRVYVTGQGLDSEWGGDLQVGGTAAAPRINGTIDIRRGTIEVIGRTLTIRTGQIRFAGGRRINPLIDILAAYETSDAEARIGLRGPADDPQFVLESTPPRPRDEVLSLILFDKRTGELTTLETVQLARALAALTGVGGGTQTGILDTVRQATGLDVLRFGQGGEGGGPGVEAGTYLGDDIYVGVEQGIDAGDGGVSVEVDLGAGFRVESKARRSGAGEVGVLWRRDY
jgi:translocation and assembly module TamB